MVFGANRATVRMQWPHGINIIHYLQELSIQKTDYCNKTEELLLCICSVRYFPCMVIYLFILEIDYKFWGLTLQGNTISLKELINIRFWNI